MVPEMTPLLLLRLRPEGRPLADQVRVSPAASVADRDNDPASPAALVWSAGPSSVIRGLTNQLKVWLPLLLPAVAVSVTLYGLSVSAVFATVPLRMPLVLLRLTPDGKPVAV